MKGIVEYMEKINKILLGIVVFGVVLPIAIIMPLTSRQDHDDQNIAGIRDYKAGHYDVAIQELNGYLKIHPLVFKNYFHFYGTSNYAEKYLGLALMKQHRYREAIDAFRIYAHCSGGNEGNYLMGLALFRNGNKAEARAKFQEVVDSEMGNGMSTRNEALVTYSEKMLDQIDHHK